MEEAKFVRVTHAGEGLFVALYAGLDPQELCRLLQAAFRLQRYVVGLVDRDSHPSHGILVPISLACKAPQLLGERTYSLILCEREVSWERVQDSPAPPRTSSHNGSPWRAELASFIAGNSVDPAGGGRSLMAPTSVTGRGQETDEEEQDEDGDDDDDDNEDEEDDIVNVDSTVKIVAFVRRMAGDGMIDEEDGNALESAAVARDSVVHAAFAVAVRSQDLDYLAALLKGIAANRRHDSTGRRMLEAKREMLDMAEVLRRAEEVDDDQLVFLQNLILVSNDEVMAAFRTYEQRRNPAHLAKSLRELCGPGVVVDTGAGKKAGLSINDPQMAGATAKAAASPVDGTSRAEEEAMKVTLLKVVVNLACRGFLGALEAKIVREMVSQESPVLMAAFKVYQEDGNMAELQDTVARAARIEAKRVMGASPSGRATRTFSPVASTRPSPLPQVGSLVGKEKGASSSASSKATAADVPLYGGDGSREEIASSREFCRFLGLAVRKGIVDMGDAKVLFAAFEGRPIEGGDSASASLSNLRGLRDMVHAAWRVFESRRDEQEVVELLGRIVRLAVKPAIETVSKSTYTAPSMTQELPLSERRASTGAAVSGIITRSIDLLLLTKRVSLEEASCLASPSPAGRRAIFNALDVFQRDSSREKLLAGLTAIAKAEKANRRRKSTISQPTQPPQETRDDTADAQQDRVEKKTDGEMSLERARMELMELAECMSEDQRISVEEAQRLTSHIEEGHPRVFAAYKEHVDKQDVEPLVEALVSIARPSQERADEDDGKDAGDDAGAEQRLRERVVLLMHETKVLDASDATRLLLLLARQDSRTKEAFQAFDSSKNVSSLVSTVNAILKEAPAVSAPDLAVLEGKDPTQTSTPLLEENIKPAAGSRSTQGRDGMAQTVLGIVEGMGLDEQEAAALRLAISCGDANIKGALEVFKLDSDARELKDTLARVARHAVEREAEVSDDVLVSREEESQDGSAAGLAHVVQSTRGVDLTVEEKETTFQIMLRHLCSVGAITETHLGVIMRRYRDKDAVVLAALDVYKEEHDLSELVDTLNRLT